MNSEMALRQRSATVVSMSHDAATDPSASPSESRTYVLDAFDRAVLHELQLDGRVPFREIARKIGAPEATVRFRVNRLRENNVLNILGFVDPAALGYGVLAGVLIRTKPGKVMDVVEALKEWPEAMYISSTVGSADLWVQIVCAGLEDLLEITGSRIGTVPGVESIETLIELKVHKARYVYAGLDDQTAAS